MLFIKKRKLRVDILTIFITLFLVTILGIIYYSHLHSSKAILKVGKDLIERTNEGIVEDLDRFLRPTPFVKISSFLLTDKQLNFSDMQSLSSFMHIILESYPQLTNVYLADQHGNMYVENQIKNLPAENQTIPFINANTIPPQTRFISEIVNKENNTSRLVINYKLNAGKIIKSDVIQPFAYNPKLRPWFLGAQNSKGEPWIGVYKFFGVPNPGITISFPIYINGKFVGVAASDLNVNIIEKELKRFSIHNKEMVFIVNNHDQVIAYDTKAIQSQSKSGIVDLKKLNNPVITKAYEIYRQSGESSFEFKENKTKYIANFKRYGFNKTEQWAIATILPNDIFVGSIQSANHNTLLFSLIMLILGLMLVIYSSHRISKPIMRLAKETKDIIKFRFDKESKIKTHIYEVQEMIDALNATKSALSSFAKYVPKALVEQLLESRTIAQVGGKKEYMTVLFTDVENFTEMSEKMDPELLMIHFSEYLNVMTQCIQKHKGNIDKYIGDAVMAFWGSPIYDANHIAHACEAVLNCQMEIHNLNKAWLEIGKPILPTRFGLHTGLVIVGNMGSSDRLNYTAIGDTVNLAARLETLNKIYGTHIIVSQAVYEACENNFLFRPADVVTVRGKRQATSVYELIAAKEGATQYAPTAEQIELCHLYCEAYENYQAKNFHQAFLLFKAILEKYPEDKLTQIYLARSKENIS